MPVLEGVKEIKECSTKRMELKTGFPEKCYDFSNNQELIVQPSYFVKARHQTFDLNMSFIVD